MTNGEGVGIALQIARDHPAFEGHFPGRPILPGVVLLAEALAALEAVTARAPHEWGIANAKLLVPVAPGTPLTLVHESLPSGAIRFEIRSPREPVASGLVVPRDESGGSR